MFQVFIKWLFSVKKKLCSGGVLNGYEAIAVSSTKYEAIVCALHDFPIFNVVKILRLAGKKTASFHSMKIKAKQSISKIWAFHSKTEPDTTGNWDELNAYRGRAKNLYSREIGITRHTEHSNNGY